MTMRDVALVLPDRAAERLAEQLERNGYRVVTRAASAADLAALLGDGTFEIVVAGASAEQLTAGLLSACDGAGIRLVALAADPIERARVSQLGLREVVDAAAPWEELAAVLERAPVLGTGSNRQAEDVPARRGTVVAVWGPTGAPGRTTVAASLAAELAAEGHSVALADADTHSGSLAPVLGLLDEAPGFAAACRLAGNDALTLAELERVGQRYSSPHGSFWVLTGIGRPHRWPELSADRVQTVVETCRDWVDCLVVDTGFSLESDEEISSDLFAPRRNAATISALRNADRVVAVGAADPVGLSRFLRSYVDLLDVVDAERVTVVMNKVRSSAIGLNPSAQVERTLQRFGGIEDAVLVPHDQQVLDAALLGGKTLRDSAAKSPTRLALAALATERVLPRPPEPSGSPRRRLFSRRAG
jgi:MinD-like ATPase involved in chromosome partitioning or flagellar assembly